MFEHGESRRKQGTVTVLAVLFGLLLGFSGSGSVQPRFDSNSARLGNGQLLRAASTVRAPSRADDDNWDDPSSAPAVPPPPPRIVTRLVVAHPIAAATSAVAFVAPLDPQFRYHARAPPAA